MKVVSGFVGFDANWGVSGTIDGGEEFVDALSTMMVNGTQVKLLVWYDNEWGYSNRMMDLTKIVASSL
ncbi:hypothetical protein N9B03_08600 [Akkermansiaceae bacterium]|nr:hypothetical protein [Akkermansiaceae bacterium]